MVWGEMSYLARSNLLRIECNLESNSRIMCANMLQILFEISVQPQHMQFLPWPAYSEDLSPTEHVLDLVGRRLARDSRPAASKDELLLDI
ncbi:hypothetical protein TNCV_1282201 [Trichonephila clavipes]|uniref:Uncharacterized protein n=1 Tax=Trichonephila clavipes TaxID=2585209 RepID=A0A8X6SKS7_TRICX|nr:hypothetical protein TNCV_1282201 [Trichonephila clavipes]